MKRVLGLDLGPTSLGWAIIEENSNEVIQENNLIHKKDKIIAIGSRIVPLNTDESNQFSKGQALTKNADRTKNVRNAEDMTVINCAELYYWKN